MWISGIDVYLNFYKDTKSIEFFALLFLFFCVVSDHFRIGSIIPKTKCIASP